MYNWLSYEAVDNSAYRTWESGAGHNIPPPPKRCARLFPSVKSGTSILFAQILLDTWQEISSARPSARIHPARQDRAGRFLPSRQSAAPCKCNGRSKLKERIIHSMLAVQNGVAVQSPLPQVLVLVQQGAVKDVRNIKEHQVVRNRDRILSRDLIADNKLMIDEIAQFRGIIAGNGNDHRAISVADGDGLIQLLDQQRGGDDQDDVVPSDPAGKDAGVVQVGDRFRIEPRHSQPELQLLGDKAGVGHREDVDVRSLIHFGRRAEYLVFVQHGGGIDQHVAVVLADGRDKAVLADRFRLPHRVVEAVLRQSHLEAVEALEPDLLAEAVDACLGCMGALGGGGDRADDHLIRMIDHILSDLVFADSQTGLHGDDLRDDG